MTPDTSIGERIEEFAQLCARQGIAVNYARNIIPELIVQALRSVKLPEQHNSDDLDYDMYDEGFNHALFEAQEALNKKIKEVEGNG